VYHSALTQPLDATREIDSYTCERGQVFAWDITHGPAAVFWDADAIYAEPAWRDGYNKFLERAGKTGSSGFPDYLAAIRDTVIALGKPAFIVAGKHMLSRLAPELTIPVTLHGYGAYAAIWRAEAPDGITDTDSLLAYVCERYETILDFSCGYGNVARAARRCILSDINRHCVYVTAKALGYDG
jgi:hypothetical protein